MTQINQYSALTAKIRTSLSYPAKLLYTKGFLKGEVLDFGCGYGTDVELLSTKGINITGYDKHYFPDYPKAKYDTIICLYVLNVLMQEEQASVLMEISQLLKPNGKAFIVVRRDIRYEGFRTHKIHQKPTYQCNVKLPYKSIYKNESCEIYEYQHYNQLSRKEGVVCPFCSPDSERKLILESATAYAMFDKYPVSKGHILIIPKKHSADYFQLTFKEQSACWFMLNKAKEYIMGLMNPDGFNVGINVNITAGQTVPHVHIHLIPRYSGDVENLEGGVRGVIPDKRKYL